VPLRLRLWWVRVSAMVDIARDSVDIVYYGKHDYAFFGFDTVHDRP
jgi:hypothetical protein